MFWWGWAVKAKELRILEGQQIQGNIQKDQCDFFKPGNYQHEEAILVPGYSSLFWLTSFKKDEIFYYINFMHRLSTKH